jgi:ABC-2 type transport system permease protein
MAALPLTLYASFVAMLVVMLLIPDAEWEGEDASSITAGALGRLAVRDAMMVQTNDMMMFILLLVPVVLPSYMAAHSIIGEKDGKSLEPLLATPLETAELLLGKTVAFVVPGTLLGWASYALVAVTGYFVAGDVVFAYLVRPAWTVGMVVLSPLLALVGTLLGVLVSSRAKDPRVAQQISGVVVMPLIGLSMAVMFGKVFLSLDLLLWSAALLAVATAGLLWLSVRLFQREQILTRWK